MGVLKKIQNNKAVTNATAFCLCILKGYSFKNFTIFKICTTKIWGELFKKTKPETNCFPDFVIDKY